MSMGDYHGDEPEIEQEKNRRREDAEIENADEWKYNKEGTQNDE